MRAYKGLIVVMALLLILILYVTMVRTVPKEGETEQQLSGNLQQCYETAKDCKEDENKCSLCFQSCSNVKGEQISQKSLEYCKLGQPEKIKELIE